MRRRKSALPGASTSSKKAAATTAATAVALLLAASCSEAALGLEVASSQEKIIGVCYGPFPAKHLVKNAAGDLLDDFMTEAAKPLWDAYGRDDLQIIKQLGANTVRTYGNNPQYDHSAFLEEADQRGLGVIPGMSDWEYTQAADSCKKKGFNCYDNIKRAYLEMLQKGFMKRKRYHPSIRHMVVINEPDLKTLDKDGVDPKMFSKLIISAIDGLISAEKEAGVKGALIPITATFSYAMCPKCPRNTAQQIVPGLSQMLELRRAFYDPQYYGYQPVNDIKAFYESRWMNSFNSQNSASELQLQFFTPYQVEFPTTKVAIEEFHSWQPPKDQMNEVRTMKAMADASPVLIGFSFFEFQVRYDKMDSERNFGLFGLGDYLISNLKYFDYTYDVWCLTPATNPYNGRPLPLEFSEAVGGEGVDFEPLCIANPFKVSLNQYGYNAVKGLNRNDAMAEFVIRVAQHMGFDVNKDLDLPGLLAFGEQVTSFDDIVSKLKSTKHIWANFNERSACVANRNSDATSVGLATDEACRSTAFNCANIPLECKSSQWDTADYVLSTYYNLKKGDPLENCHFEGAARFSSPNYYRSYDRGCVVNRDPETTPLTDEGFQAIKNLGDWHQMRRFVKRYIRKNFDGADIADTEDLAQFSANPPDSMYEVQRLLKNALWICGGNTKRTCRVSVSSNLWWWNYALASVGAATVLTCMCVFIWVKLEHCCIKAETTLTDFARCKPFRELNEDDAASSDSH